MSPSALFHGLGLFGCVPALMLAYLQKPVAAGSVMGLVFLLHLLGIITDKDTC